MYSNFTFIHEIMCFLCFVRTRHISHPEQGEDHPFMDVGTASVNKLGLCSKALALKELRKIISSNLENSSDSSRN